MAIIDPEHPERGCIMTNDCEYHCYKCDNVGCVEDCEFLFKPYPKDPTDDSRCGCGNYYDGCTYFAITTELALEETYQDE
jgi:hypothetical protein